MAKTSLDLEKSREFRKEFIAKYDGIVTSIWKIDFSKNRHAYETADLIAKDKRLRNYFKADVTDLTFGEQKNEKQLNEKAFSSSGSGVRGKDGGLSRFPVDMAMRIIKFYSQEGETIFDPCHGHVYENRLYCAYYLKRKYIGYDICKEFYEQNLVLIEYLMGKKDQGDMFVREDLKPEVFNKSSECIHLPDCSVDLSYTSPPYWDIEYYDDNPEQYGYQKTYEQFLSGIKNMMSEIYRILKHDKFLVLNINDFRKEGKFYDYHSDISRLGKEVGFKLHDIIIVDWGSSLQSCFASQLEERKMSAKIHEYLIVLKKE